MYVFLWYNVTLVSRSQQCLSFNPILIEGLVTKIAL